MRSAILYLDNIFFNSMDGPYTVVCDTYSFWNTSRKAILGYGDWNGELKRLRSQILYALVNWILRAEICCRCRGHKNSTTNQSSKYQHRNKQACSFFRPIQSH